MSQTLSTPVKSNIHKTGTVAEWNEAYDRLRDYLDAYLLGDRRHEAALIVEILEAAGERHIAEPDRTPVEVTLAEAQERVTAWFTAILPEDHAESRSPALASTVAFFTGDLYQEKPDLFLRDDLTPNFQHRMRRSALRTGPDLEISSMTSRNFDYGPLVQARDTFQRGEWAPVLQAFLFWTFIYFAGLFAWHNFFR